MTLYKQPGSPKWYTTVLVAGKPRKVALHRDKKISTLLAAEMSQALDRLLTGRPVDVCFLSQAIKPRFQSLAAEALGEEAYSALVPSNLTLADLIKHYRIHLSAMGRSEKYVNETISYLERFMMYGGYLYITDVSRENVRAWLSYLNDDGKGLSARTLNAALQALKSFSRHSVNEGDATVDKLAGMKGLNDKVDRRYVRRALTQEEVSKLVNAAVPRALLWEFMIRTGLRKTEALSLRWMDLKLDTPEPYVLIPAKVAKAREDQMVALSRGMTELLLAERSFDFDAIGGNKAPFFELRVFPFQSTTLLKHLRRDLATAGIEEETDMGKIDLHSLRHTTATLLAKQGVSPLVIMQIMRHASITTTLRYTKLTVADQAGAVEEMEL